MKKPLIQRKETGTTFPVKISVPLNVLSTPAHYSPAPSPLVQLPAHTLDLENLSKGTWLFILSLSSNWILVTGSQASSLQKLDDQLSSPTGTVLCMLDPTISYSSACGGPAWAAPGSRPLPFSWPSLWPGHCPAPACPGASLEHTWDIRDPLAFPEVYLNQSPSPSCKTFVS